MKTKVLWLALISVQMMIGQGCSKTEIQDVEKVKDPGLKTISDIQVNKGVICFKTPEAFDNLANCLSTMNDQERANWERSIGYKSLFSIIQGIYSQIDSITTEEKLDDILVKNKSLIAVENVDGENFICPIINHPIFSRIANTDGLYMIKNKVYKITKSYLLITDEAKLESLKFITDNDIQFLDRKNYEIFNLANPSRRKIYSASMTAYKDLSGCNDDRCIVTDMGSDLIPYSDRDQHTCTKTTIYLKIESWRKNFLCYWYQYPTIITRNNVSFTYTLAGSPSISRTWGDYTSLTEENGNLEYSLIYDWGRSIGVPADMTQMHAETTHRGMDGVWCTIDY